MRLLVVFFLAAVGGAADGFAQVKLDDLIVRLTQNDWDAKARFIDLGERGRAYLPQLLHVVRTHKDPLAREIALRHYCRLSPVVSDRVSVLIRALKIGNPSGRAWAVRLLGNEGAVASRAVPLLRRLLHDQRTFHVGAHNHMIWEETVRSEVAESLGKIGPAARTATPDLLRMMWTDNDQKSRLSAAVALLRIDDCNCLAMKYVVDHLEAFPIDGGAVGELRTRAWFALPTLLAGTTNRNGHVRVSSWDGVALVHGGKVRDLLIKALRDPFENVRSTVALRLGELGARGGKVALRALVDQHRKERNGFVQQDFVRAMTQIQRNMKPAQRSWLWTIIDTRQMVWAGQPVYEHRAVMDLARVSGGPKAVEICLRSLQHPHPAVQELAVRTLGGLGKTSHSALPRLYTVLQDNREVDGYRLRRAAARAIGLIGSQLESSRDITVKLNQIYRRPEEFIRIAAVQAHGFLATKRSITAVVAALDDKHYDVRVAAGRALGRLGVRGAPGVPRLVKSLNQTKTPDDFYFRRTSVMALGNIGRPAKVSLPTLRRIAKSDSDKVLRQIAREAIQRIE